MFGMGMQELIVILIVAIIFIGPRKLPDIARGLGKALREFRRATDDIKHNISLDPIDVAPPAKPRTAAAPPTPPPDNKETHEQTTPSENKD